MPNQQPADFHQFVDATAGTVDRSVFSDTAIYQLELERIYARAWNFMCHESQIPKPGDFFLNYIGEDAVIATRNKKGELRVLLNTCRHRGNAICRAEMGNARSFMCTYHGWTYDLDGKLIGVPGYRDFYHQDLEREKWGLIHAAQVTSYKGFVFATMDPDAPPLESYLGPVGRLGLDLAAERGDVMVVDGVQKNVIGCNWKLAVDNLFDWYHVQISHASAAMSGYLRPPPFSPMDHVVALGEYGHAISGPRLTEATREKIAAEQAETKHPQIDESWRDQPRARQVLGPVGIETRGHPNIFPNLWIASSGTQLSLRLPRGPDRTEIWWFTLIDRNIPAERRDKIVRRANHTFGPAGMLEQDDGENWDQSTRATRGVIGRRYPLNFSMNLGRGEIRHDQPGLPHIATHVNEHAQLWTYRAWADWMNAKDWAALKRHHAVPEGVV
jgi:phenylpropionate dioxygenase-like ring-hydroxylating dioxygenase large terminal subunit